MHEQGSVSGYPYYLEGFKGSALMLASRRGMTGVVEKMLAAGAHAELTDEVNGRKRRRVVDASSASGWENREQCACVHMPLAAVRAFFMCMRRLRAVPPVESGYVCQ